MDKATERQRHTEHCSLTSCHSSCWFSFRSYEKRHDKLVEAVKLLQERLLVTRHALREMRRVATGGQVLTIDALLEHNNNALAQSEGLV